MYSYNNSAIAINNSTLPFTGVKAIVFGSLVITAAVVLPMLSHLMALPVIYLLPMHWPVIFAGLVYGWRAGAVAGLFSPIVSFIITGMPPASILPVMTVEIFVYGALTGFLRENIKLNSFLSVTIALIVGRIAYLMFFLITHSFTMNLFDVFQYRLLPGIIAAIAQIVLLPFLAGFTIKSLKQERTKV